MPPHNTREASENPTTETVDNLNAGSAVEKINTRKATPAELFESKVIDLAEGVLRRRLSPSESVRELHRYWKNELSEEERDALIDRDSSGNIIEVGARLMSAANMLGQEMFSLLASHQAMKGLG